MITKKQLTSVISSWGQESSESEAEIDLDYDDYASEHFANLGDDLQLNQVVELAPGIEAKLVESFGGEGKGEDCWFIFSIGEQFFRINGYYSSWDGTDWTEGSLEEVFPREVTTINFLTKKEAKKLDKSNSKLAES